MELALFERSNGEWDYRFTAANGNLLVHSEGYSTKGNAKRAAKEFLDSIQTFLLEGNEQHIIYPKDSNPEIINEGL